MNMVCGLYGVFYPIENFDFFGMGGGWKIFAENFFSFGFTIDFYIGINIIKIWWYNNEIY
jgi:hypothetical protein